MRITRPDLVAHEVRRKKLDLPGLPAAVPSHHDDHTMAACSGPVPGAALALERGPVWLCSSSPAARHFHRGWMFSPIHHSLYDTVNLLYLTVANRINRWRAAPARTLSVPTGAPPPSQWKQVPGAMSIPSPSSRRPSGPRSWHGTVLSEPRGLSLLPWHRCPVYSPIISGFRLPLPCADRRLWPPPSSTLERRLVQIAA